MKIPIQNLYFLLCYAWDTLEEKDTVDVSQEDFKAYVDLFAKILINGTTRLLKRGLDRGYLEFEEDTRNPRGKFDLSQTLKRQLLLQARIHCRFDVLDHNVLHNQILRTTLGNLARCQDLDRDLQDQVVRLYRRLKGVEDIHLTKKKFRRVVLHRNNHYYRFLLHVCELIHDHLLVDEASGKSRFRDFLRDEKAMARLFEAFVRKFYKKEQSEFSVSSERIVWEDVEGSADDLRFLPTMLTDVSLKSRERHLVIETKYYTKTLQSHMSREKVHSGNIYQLFAYLKNLEMRDARVDSHDVGASSDLMAPRSHSRVEGMLLYPSVGQELDLKYTVHGHPFRVATVDLDADWRQIHRRLLALLAPIREELRMAG